MAEEGSDARVADAALGRYGLSDRRTLHMINLSENATFRVADPGTGRSGILRVHRVGYHTAAAIESELDWLTALRDDADVATPQVVRTLDDARVVTVEIDGRDRHAVLFEVMPGVEPAHGGLDTAGYGMLGAITARLHRHARGWRSPAEFTRFAWDWEHSLGGAPRWGRWQDGIDVGPSEVAVLGEAAELVRRRLDAYGTGPDRFGLVHADLRLANLLVDGDQVNVIDFDDCGFSWFMYDFGAAVSFLEHDPRLPEWQDAWSEGYRSEEPLPAEHEEMLPTFVMLRRLLLVAWMGSHAHSREAQELGPAHTFGSVDLARRYVASDGRTL
ncbi:phosphotransferase enzyme family protein [Spirillospora sp. CA-255316]